MTPGTTPPSDGRSRRWDRHRELRRAHLVREATRAIHHAGPDIAMDEIATLAGTSKSIYYRYFTDKAALQEAIGAVVVAQMHEALAQAAGTAPTPRAALRAMVDQYLTTVEASPNVYRFVIRPGEVAADAPVRRFLPDVAALVARPFAGELADDARLLEAWAVGAVGFVRGVGEWWLDLDPADRPPRADVVDRITTWLWTGPVAALTRHR